MLIIRMVLSRNFFHGQGGWNHGCSPRMHTDFF